MTTNNVKIIPRTGIARIDHALTALDKIRQEYGHDPLKRDWIERCEPYVLESREWRELNSALSFLLDGLEG